MAKVVEFNFNSGGFKLWGRLHSPAFSASCCAVVCHGFNGYGDSPKWNFICRGLARAGIPALRFSHRGCDKSEGHFEDTTIGSRIEDLHAAMDALQEETGMSSFGLIGSSLGGAAVLLCADDPRVSCCFTLAAPADFDFFDTFAASGPRTPYGNFIVDGREVKPALLEESKHHDIIAAAAKARNLFILHGGKDTVIPPAHAQRIYDAAPQPKKLLIAPEADHPFTGQHHQDIMLAELLAWFKMRLTSRASGNGVNQNDPA